MNELVEIVIDAPEATPKPVEANSANLHQIPPIGMDEEFMNFSAGNDYLTVKLTPYGARLEKNDDPSYFKNVSLKSLARAIMDDASIDTGFLPLFGSNYIGIRRYMQFRDKHLIFIEASEGIRMAKFDNGNVSEDYHIPHPFMLMAVRLKEMNDGKFKVEDIRMFAMRSPLFMEEAQLYKYPYGNVYTGSQGKICWGDYQSEVDRVRYNNFLQSGELMNTFIHTGYNDDLFHSSTQPISGQRTFRDVYQQMSERDSYPYDSLSENIKFSELVSLLKNN